MGPLRSVEVIFRRSELHAQVWAEPMRAVAKKYGMSDVALARRCRKWGIPLPVQGHWNKVAAGKTVKTLPLPPLPKGAVEEARQRYWRRPTHDEGGEPLPPSPPLEVEQDAGPESAVGSSRVRRDTMSHRRHSSTMPGGFPGIPLARKCSRCGRSSLNRGGLGSALMMLLVMLPVVSAELWLWRSRDLSPRSLGLPALLALPYWWLWLAIPAGVLGFAWRRLSVSNVGHRCPWCGARRSPS